jgi:tetraacyldisaccharide-1-P 4'-kinase
VAGSDEDAARVADATGVRLVFRALARYHVPRRIAPGGAGEAPASGARVLAVAAIARPERFFAAVRGLGWDLVGTVTFRDHHWFSARDVDRVRRAAADAGASLVMTTEKDAVRLPLEAMTGEALPWAVLPLEMSIHPQEVFSSWLAGRLVAARGSGDEGRPTGAGAEASRETAAGGEAAARAGGTP